eukprot:TRINITY_DN8484_c0_g3_i1.p2 TRINITY_DN8484_c0_g3~~TRINITY_DN8484_c0_g3_i1.p2  ORF type:complete len:119 (-),score=43.58 TRINITY_DN8484_c0_g3_i1:14-370(-)
MSEEKKADSAPAAAADEKEFTGEVFLVSQDGQKFKVSTKTAAMSELVKTMLGEAGGDDEEEEDEEDAKEIPLPNVKGPILSKVVEFCKKHVEDPMPEIEKPLKSAVMKEVVGQGTQQS